MDEDRNYEKELRPEDMIPDEDALYESEAEHTVSKLKEKPAGPPLEMEIPLIQPPAESNKVYLCSCFHFKHLLRNQDYLVFFYSFRSKDYLVLKWISEFVLILI